MDFKRKFAATLIGLLFIYYEIFRWIPLGRWNWQFHFPVVNDQFYPDLVIGALLLWFAWSVVGSRRSGVTAACALLLLWSVVHLFDWWIPYMKDLPQNAGRFSFYQSHTQILPVIGHHYPPDAGHAILDLLLYPTCVATILAAFPSKPKNQKA